MSSSVMGKYCRACITRCGFNSFKPGELEQLYAHIMAEGLDTYLFSNGTIQSSTAFERAVTHPDVWFYVVYAATAAEHAPLALAVLDCFKGTTAHLHFVFFRQGRAQRHALATRFLRLLFDSGLTAIFGCTSIRWRHVRAFARDIGFVETIRVPGYHEHLNRQTGEMEYHDSMLALCTPQTLNHSILMKKEASP